MSQSQRAAMALQVLQSAGTVVEKRPARQTMRERRAAKVQRACAELGIQIYSTPGGALRLFGHGVDLITTDLSSVIASDLQPFTEAQARQAAYRNAAERRRDAARAERTQFPNAINT